MKKIIFVPIAFSFNQVFASGSSVGTLFNSRVGTLSNSRVGNFKTTHGGETLHALGVGGGGSGGGALPEL